MGVNPTDTNTSVPPQQPSAWDAFTQKAQSLHPLSSLLGQADNNLGQRSLNALHGDGFRTDAQIYPLPSTPPALAVPSPVNPPLRGGAATGGGLMANPLQNGQGSSQAPGRMSAYSRACVLAGLRGMIRDTEGMNRLPDGGYGSFASGGKVIANPQNLDGIRLKMNSRDARIADPGALSGHPDVDVQLYRNGQKYVKSDAFGAYQILGDTARDRGYTDFSHAGQDAAANDLIENRRRMLSPAMQGDWPTVFHRGSLEWASLPGDHYRQGGKSPEEAIAAYNRAIQSAPECK
ncbi:hypothetical protein AciX8_2985 [Granulicella mallensis MP5ACTX8]|uniref:Uncharacterized protein n=2 Tax=Granulicella mallensis TaxID=940614 RepID=G8NRD0_GRAMM|nr:hypothetical protein AciX8_2985 [Granulicella mallensis MP5ACTX8]